MFQPAAFECLMAAPFHVLRTFLRLKPLVCLSLIKQKTDGKHRPFLIIGYCLLLYFVRPSSYKITLPFSIATGKASGKSAFASFR